MPPSFYYKTKNKLFYALILQMLINVSQIIRFRTLSVHQLWKHSNFLLGSFGMNRKNLKWPKTHL